MAALNDLIDEYSQTTQFSRADLTDLAREVVDVGAFEWIVSAWMSGYRTNTPSMVAMYQSAQSVKQDGA